MPTAAKLSLAEYLTKNGYDKCISEKNAKKLIYHHSNNSQSFTLHLFADTKKIN